MKPGQLSNESRRVKETDLEILSNFTNKSLEGKLADEQLSRLLIPTNFTESDSSGPEAMGLLYTSSGSLRKTE